MSIAARIAARWVNVVPQPGGEFKVGPKQQVLEVEAVAAWDVAPDGRILVAVTDADARLREDQIIVGWTLSD